MFEDGNSKNILQPTPTCRILNPHCKIQKPIKFGNCVSNPAESHIYRIKTSILKEHVALDQTSGSLESVCNRFL